MNDEDQNYSIIFNDELPDLLNEGDDIYKSLLDINNRNSPLKDLVTDESSFLINSSLINQ